jgi:iron(III) transport system permease protein
MRSPGVAWRRWSVPAVALERFTSERAWWLLLFGGLCAVLLYLVGTPLLALLVSTVRPNGLPLESGFTLEHYQTVLTDDRTYQLLVTSLIFSAGSVTIALLFGAPLAWFVERTTFPFKDGVRTIILGTVALPFLLVAIGWVLLLSPQIGLINAWLRAIFGPGVTINGYSLPSMMLVQGLAMVPGVFVMLSPVFRNMDGSFEEAALMSSSGLGQVLRSISLPLVRPALAGTLIYSLMASLLSFDIPATLGIPSRIFVLSSELYFNVSVFTSPRYGEVSVLSLVLMVVAIFAAVLYMRTLRASRRYATVSGKFRSHQLDLGRWNMLGWAWLGTYLVLILLPLSVLIWTSFLPVLGQVSRAQAGTLTLSNYQAVLSAPNAGLALRDTIVNSVTAATVGTLLCILVANVVVKSGLKRARLLDLLAFLPLVIPGIVLGLSLRYVYLSMSFLPIYGSLWIITIAHVTESFPFGTRNANSGLVQVHPELEEAALISGRSFANAFRTITLPLVSPTLLFIWLWILMHSVRELSASVMLYTPSTPLVSTLLWQLINQSADFPAAAALSTLLLLGELLITFVTLRVLKRMRGATGLV